MNIYLVNNIETIEFRKMITLLDYDKRLSNILKLLNLSSLKGESVLINTALVSGVNKYRFIESKVTDEGYLNLFKLPIMILN